MREALFTLVLSFPALVASAQSGLRLTEEATTAAAGTLAIEARVDAISAEPNFLTGEGRTRWEIPILRIVHSPAENVEVDLEWVGRVVAVDDAGSGTVSDWGDVTLRAKVRLLQSQDRRTAFGTRFFVSLPETKAQFGLGPNTLRMAAEGLLSGHLGRGAFHANAGLLIHDKVDAAAAQSDFLSYGLALERPIGSRAAIVAEIAGRVGSGSRGADDRSEVRLGVEVGSGRFRWSLGARRGLVDPHGTWGATVGVTWIAMGEKAPAPSVP